jgi:hypothetical protein
MMQTVLLVCGSADEAISRFDLDSDVERYDREQGVLRALKILSLSGLSRIRLRLGRIRIFLPVSSTSSHLNPRADHPSDNSTSTAGLEVAFYCWKNFIRVQTADLVQQETIDSGP